MHFNESTCFRILKALNQCAQLALGALLVTAVTQTASAASLTLFADAADLGNLAVTNGPGADSVVVDGASTPLSAFPGNSDAIRMFDTDGSRTTVRWRPTDPNPTQFQMSFDYVADSSATGKILFRGGNDGAGLASISRSGFSVEIQSDGSIVYAYDDNTPDRTSSATASFGVDTPVSVDVVVNTATSGDLNYNVGSNPVALGPQQFDLYVNGVAVDTGLNLLNSEANFDGSLGIQDFWFLTGGSSAETGSEHQIDNWVFKSGADITVVPEPSTALLGCLALLTLGCRRA